VKEVITISRLLTRILVAVAFARAMFQSINRRWAAVVAFGAASLTLVAGPALAGATETETKVKEVAEKVGTEGVSIVLLILTALVGLLVAIIIIPKAIALIRRFV